ncbi:MAG: hypothetical protein KBG77_16835, partial [Dermatophilaceae bacterium]|nr:hypothetical protein [Dermatophilaceae bacterium]
GWCSAPMGEGDRLMADATPLRPHERESRRLEVEAMSRADGCPECGDNYEPPKRATLTPDLSAYSCAYRCTSCGHTWETSWAPGSIDWMP